MTKIKKREHIRSNMGKFLIEKATTSIEHSVVARVSDSVGIKLFSQLKTVYRSVYAEIQWGNK